jgi:hypothetical protein
MGETPARLDAHELLRRLQEARLPFRIDSIRDGILMFEVALPGEIWEIEIFPDGHAEIERFRSDGTIYDAGALEELFARWKGDGE